MAQCEQCGYQYGKAPCKCGNVKVAPSEKSDTPSSAATDGYAHPFGEPPHPADAPILLLYDADLGWIVEAVVDGEYEVQNMPLEKEENSEPDFRLAANEARKRNTYVEYYPE